MQIEYSLSCTHCGVLVVNQTLQVRRIGYWRVAVSSSMLQITADVRHHYRSDTTKNMTLHLMI